MQASVRQTLTGIGPVRIGDSWTYAYWQYLYDEDDGGGHSDQRWMIRVSLDEFGRLNLPPFQWVWLQLPGRHSEKAYFHESRDDPPFTVLTFDRVPEPD